MTIITALYTGRGDRFNALVRRWQRSPYSHTELVWPRGDGLWACWSSSVSDGGVRCKVMVLNPAHWQLWAIPGDAAAAKQWFAQREGQGYDLLGLLGFAWRPWQGRHDRWWCSEACAAAVGATEPWRWDVAAWAQYVQLVGHQLPRKESAP